MSISRQLHTATPYHGLHLVPGSNRLAEPHRHGFVYKITAVAAALFLAMTVC